MDKTIEEEWIFWGIFQKYPILLFAEDVISYKKLMKIYSIIQMESDYEIARIQYDIKKNEKIRSVN